MGDPKSPTIKSNMQKWFLIFALVVFGNMPPESFGQQPKSPEGWPKWQGAEGWPKWPDPNLLDSNLKDAGKKLDTVKGISKPGPDIEFLYSRASELLKRSSQARENWFRCERLTNAANALLDAAYGIFSSRKADRTPQDFWGVGKVLQSLHFRVQQADYFASISGEKNTDQYITLARSIYQQGRSAYDAHEYQKAKYLTDASWSIVTALENIALAAIPPPAPPGVFK
jgi:hypothetical protein